MTVLFYNFKLTFEARVANIVPPYLENIRVPYLKFNWDNKTLTGSKWLTTFMQVFLTPATIANFLSNELNHYYLFHFDFDL